VYRYIKHTLFRKRQKNIGLPTVYDRTEYYHGLRVEFGMSHGSVLAVWTVMLTRLCLSNVRFIRKVTATKVKSQHTVLKITLKMVLEHFKHFL